MIRILVILITITFWFSCGAKDNIEWKRPTKNMAKTWKEYYQKCLDENPSNKEKCDELKEKYEMELESTQQMGTEPYIGQEPYY
ncbi:MAG: hypothetical protein GTO02_21515 [Candidatus Dadabacteria bacterium]|nr:hypothetical protein [Candidatus Dadabacteria bacterium]NIQ16863.1 hypothetical protein [Candidatus Dadabacteria bacterium]